jgi:aldehyde dehydrogenase (NAD+)
MQSNEHFYIGGQWVEPAPGAVRFERVDPATEAPCGHVLLGAQADVDRAVGAAREAFPAWSRSTREERLALLGKAADLCGQRMAEMAQAIVDEIGAPAWLCREYQAPIALAQIQHACAALTDFAFESMQGTTRIERTPIGVAALITAWNWPADLFWSKVAPALAAGCTVVLKPSELAPLDACLSAQVLHDAGVPPGVFNLVFGAGPSVGAALARHADVDMVSITGSTRAGAEVAAAAAPGIKRVVQELGGKSANVILDDADLKAAVSSGVISCMLNSGQTCVAPTRMLVPRRHYAAAVAIAQGTVAALPVGDPRDAGTRIGPLASRAQYDKVQRLIAAGIAEGARVVAGGPGRPDGLTRGFFARPTVFADVRNDMAIAREEIFGPVLCLIAYDGGDEEAIAIANDSPYGLAGHVWSADPARARRVASRLRVGSVRINGAALDFAAPFGGFKASGNGREHGPHGIAEFLETRAVMG